MNYTTGPWFLNLENDTYITVHTEHRDICDMTTDFGDVAEAEANGRLVAAAPEMLAILEELEESAAYWSEYDVPVGIVERIREAIKKARGEE